MLSSNLCPKLCILTVFVPGVLAVVGEGVQGVGDEPWLRKPRDHNLEAARAAPGAGGGANGSYRARAPRCHLC